MQIALFFEQAKCLKNNGLYKNSLSFNFKIQIKMSETLVKSTVLEGGSFIIQDSTPDTTFIPEQANEEQLMVKGMVEDFIKNDIEPNRVALEKQKEGLAIQMLEKMGDLGLLGTHMPEVYGGTAMDTNTNTMICDALGPAGGFTVKIGRAHV